MFMRGDIRPIGIFDSGIGGISVLGLCAKKLPNEKFIYLADKANMPYGEKSTDEIRTAAISCAKTLVETNCKAIVVACNTATETAIDDIRRLFPSLIVVGLEPALKPCYYSIGSGYAVALVTRATERSAKFKRLMSAYGDKIIACPQPELARLIETHDINSAEIKSAVYSALKNYRDASGIVLGCSHYTFVKKIIADFYDGNILIYDGADGASDMLKTRLILEGLCAPKNGSQSIRFYSTY